MAEHDFEELLRLFNRHRVRYCIVGAYAVAFHARPRYTKDLDMVVDPTLQNGRQVVTALQAFGFGRLKLTPEDFAQPGRCIQLGYEPVRIDLLTSIEGCSFEQIWQHRVRGAYGRQRAWFIGQEELIHTKRASGRAQDRSDLDILRRSRRPSKTRGAREPRGEEISRPLTRGVSGRAMAR